MKIVKSGKKFVLDFRFRDGRFRVVGFTDEKATRRLADHIEMLMDVAYNNGPLTLDLSRSVDSMPARIVRTLEKAGLLPATRTAGRKRLTEHLDDYKLCLQAKGDTLEYVATTAQRINQIFTGCKFTTWSDISASRVQRYIAGLREGENGISIQSHNYYLQAVKGFCRWMVQDRRASESPLTHLKGLNVRTDRRHDRRALEPDEIRRLLEVTRQEPTRWKMTGPERAWLLQLAAESGLRSNEIRSLKVNSFDFDKCTVTVRASYSKRKREDTLPLKPDTAAELQRLFSGKLPDAQAFRMPSKSNVVRMLRQDLEAAGIEYQDAAGRFADFHSLRHTTGSLLAASGVHPKVAQSIMRHSTIELTLGRYSHIYKGQETDAIAALPDLTQPSQQRQEARGTGTDDFIVKTDEKKLPKICPKSANQGENIRTIPNNSQNKEAVGSYSKTAILSEKSGFLGKNGGDWNWAEADSNRRHMDFQSIALPTELSTRLNCLGCTV